MFTTFVMMCSPLRTVSVVLSIIAAASASQDVSSVLSTLGPAPSNDRRWTNYQAPGQGDGISTVDCRLARTADLLSALAVPGSQHAGEPWLCMMMPCRTIQLQDPDHRLNQIHHNGKNMTIPHLVAGLAEGMKYVFLGTNIAIPEDRTDRHSLP